MRTKRFMIIILCVLIVLTLRDIKSKFDRAVSNELMSMYFSFVILFDLVKSSLLKRNFDSESVDIESKIPSKIAKLSTKSPSLKRNSDSKSVDIKLKIPSKIAKLSTKSPSLKRNSDSKSVDIKLKTLSKIAKLSTKSPSLKRNSDSKSVDIKLKIISKIAKLSTKSPSLKRNSDSKSVDIKLKTLTKLMKNQNDDIISKVDKLQEKYFKLITQNQIDCPNHNRPGNGNWNMCFEKQFSPKQGDCLMYSFGVNNDWVFDDTVAQNYNCTVRSFDPSMTIMPMQMQRKSKVWFYRIGLGDEDTTWNNGWKIMKLDSLLRKFKEDDRILDILKIDIDASEWNSLENIFKTNILTRVKQIMFVTHSFIFDNDHINRYIKIWKQLESKKFKQWHNHFNPICDFTLPTSNKSGSCITHYLINLSFKK